MPRCRVIDPAFTWGEDRAPRTAWERTVVYELHVRGYTKLHPSVAEGLRGTYRGLTEPQVLDHIRSLGVTAVELLPVHTFVNDSHLGDRGLTNYWGYNTISFFAPARRYAHVPDFAFSEFKEMVARFHDAGIEVILDVVYNHTAEGNHLGPTLSSTTRRTIGCCRTSRATTSTIPELVTPSISRTRVYCRWSQTRSAIGCRRCMSTAFASI
jgi:isoamylase